MHEFLTNSFFPATPSASVANDPLAPIRRSFGEIDQLRFPPGAPGPRVSRPIPPRGLRRRRRLLLPAA